MGRLLYIKGYGKDRGVPSACLLPKSFQFHSLQLNGISRVIYRRRRCASHVLRHLHLFVKIRTIHETSCLWSVFKFLWVEDFDRPDSSKQSRLKLALLNETSLCKMLIFPGTVDRVFPSVFRYTSTPMKGSP